ncbi:hypothetical protein CEXT_731801 [Caerostris extrusa]|uniref:Uncharacterized protein n=1 Tax=Caerostris extrusa TaxID=172846 RepID=A0AAV4NBY5_CAEEX|nr:hypothetical protein CEXT_731801 [Caerostris extrusa]
MQEKKGFRVRVRGCFFFLGFPGVGFQSRGKQIPLPDKVSFRLLGRPGVGACVYISISLIRGACLPSEICMQIFFRWTRYPSRWIDEPFFPRDDPLFGEDIHLSFQRGHSFLPKRIPRRGVEKPIPNYGWGLILNDAHYVPRDLQQKLELHLWERRPNL